MSVPDGEHSVVKIVSTLAVVSDDSRLVLLEYGLVSFDGDGDRLFVDGGN